MSLSNNNNFNNFNNFNNNSNKILMIMSKKQEINRILKIKSK